MAISGTKNTDSRKKKATISELERNRLFELYIRPRFTSIMALTVRYTDRYQDKDDNFTLVLSQLFSYIHTYNPSKSIDTWIHIVVKRSCFKQNKRRAKYNQLQTPPEMCTSEMLHQHGTANIVDAGFGTLVDNLSDEVYDALLAINPYHLSPFLLWAQGIGIKDIASMEYKMGHLDRKSEELVKSRIFWAKKKLQHILKQNGIKGPSR